MSGDEDLYEYPSGHVGCRTYVSVRGHSRSIPKYKTYKGTDHRNYLHPDYGGDWSGYGKTSAYIMPDKQPYVSPLEPGVVVTSRSQHREHMRKHDVIEAGDMPIGYFDGYNRDAHPGVSGRDIVDAIKRLGGE